MADSPTGDKTEKPTPKKLRDARKKGDVAQSKETATAVVFIVLCAISFWLIPDLLEELSSVLDTLIENAGSLSPGVIGDSVVTVISVVFKILMLPLSITFASVVITKLMEVGPIFSSESMKIDFSKLAFKGAKNIFSKKNVFDWLVSVLKTTVILFILISLICYYFYDIAKTAQCDLNCVLTVWGRIAAIAIFMVALLSVLVAFIDISAQRFFHEKKLMMSLYDVKKENKETQGNPEIKSKRKKIHKEILSSSVKSNVAKSSVLVTNPTHVAIGLCYKEGQSTLPTISLKEVESNALLARRIAYYHDIPILEDPPLARALLAKAQLNEYIPEEFIDEVVVVLKWAMATQEAQARKKNGLN